jgi:hypothetical protein
LPPKYTRPVLRTMKPHSTPRLRNALGDAQPCICAAVLKPMPADDSYRAYLFARQVSLSCYLLELYMCVVRV